MAKFTETRTETYHVVSCYTCGVSFGIGNALHNRAVTRKLGSVYCPACGMGTHWTGKTEAEKVREEMQRQLHVANTRADRNAAAMHKARRRATKSERSLLHLEGRK